MFDISFSELVIIAVVALLVIGPEKLPTLARTLGAVVGRLQRYMAQIKDEVGREARFEDLQKLQQEIKQGVQQAESSIKSNVRSLIDNPKEVTQHKARSKTNSIKKSPPKAPQR